MSQVDRIAGLTGTLGVKAPVRAATTSNITLSGLQTVDGVALSAGERVLVKDQTSAIDNGVWDVAVGAWSRSPDFDGQRDVVKGTAVWVTDGTENANTAWAISSEAPTIGSALSFLRAFSSSALVSFLQSGIGAVARFVQDKLRDELSAFDFMTSAQIADAKARTATTDATAALQAAVDACAAGGKRTLYLPLGLYKITTALNIPAGVSLRGEGGEASVISCLSCGGLVFNSASYDNGSVSFRDFGLGGHAGSTANQIAITSHIPSGGVVGTDSRDGLHFNRLKIRDFDKAFDMGSTWEWSASACQITKINQAFYLGNYVLVSRINNNMIVHEGGDSFSGTSASIGINLVGPVTEGVTIVGNEIFGFAKDIAVTTALYVNIDNNDLEATEVGVDIGTANSGLNIKNNYIQLDGASAIAAIREAALGSEIASQINIEGNNLIATGTATCSGILLGSGTATNAFHNSIVGNLFSGFSGSDISAPNPGKLRIQGNRCLSTGSAASIAIGSVQSTPVIVDANDCVGTITYAAADRASGVLMLRNNLTSTSTQDIDWVVAGDLTVGGCSSVGGATPSASGAGITFPSAQSASSNANTLDDYEEGTWTPVLTPDAGSFTGVTYAVNRGGSYTKTGNQVTASGYVRTDSITVGTASGPIYISGLPFVVSANAWRDSGSIGYADAFNVNNPCAVRSVTSTDRLTFSYITTANGVHSILQVSDLAVGASSNFLFFSITYTV